LPGVARVTGYVPESGTPVAGIGSVYRDSEALQISQLREMIAAVLRMEEKWTLLRRFRPEDGVARALFDCRVRLEQALNELEK